MTFLDSPIGRCEAVREMVLLDETQKECAREHGCPDGRNCPLKGWFTEQSGVSDPANLPAKRATPRRRSAAAAKLRQLSPMLVTRLKNRGWDVATIRIKVYTGR